MKNLTLDEYHAELKAQDVPIEHCAMICPACGTIQSAQDLIEAGAGGNLDEVEKYLGYSCVGRWTHKKQPPKEKESQVGCNWTLGGLFKIHNMIVTTPDGSKCPRFELCTPEEAQKHMKNKATMIAQIMTKPPFEECLDKIGAAVNEAMKAGVPPTSLVMILEMTEIAMEHIQRLKFQMQMHQAKAMANDSDKPKIITGK